MFKPFKSATKSENKVCLTWLLTIFFYWNRRWSYCFRTIGSCHLTANTGCSAWLLNKNEKTAYPLSLQNLSLQNVFPYDSFKYLAFETEESNESFNKYLSTYFCAIWHVLKSRIYITYFRNALGWSTSLPPTLTSFFFFYTSWKREFSWSSCSCLSEDKTVWHY